MFLYRRALGKMTNEKLCLGRTLFVTRCLCLEKCCPGKWCPGKWCLGKVVYREMCPGKIYLVKCVQGECLLLLDACAQTNISIWKMCLGKQCLAKMCLGKMCHFNTFKASYQILPTFTDTKQKNSLNSHEKPTKNKNTFLITFHSTKETIKTQFVVKANFLS